MTFSMRCLWLRNKGRCGASQGGADMAGLPLLPMISILALAQLQLIS
jgi:hypothetical protein